MTTGHPEMCNRLDCKNRRDEDCTEKWHAPVSKPVKKLARCPIGDTCRAWHLATRDTKGCSTQSGCALWHPKPAKKPCPQAQCQLRKRHQEDTSWPQRLLQSQERREGQGHLLDMSAGGKRKDVGENCRNGSIWRISHPCLSGHYHTQHPGRCTLSRYNPLCRRRPPLRTSCACKGPTTCPSRSPCKMWALWVSWNAANLPRGTKELVLAHLLVSNNADVAVIIETELPAPSAVVFSIEGYTIYFPAVLPHVKKLVIGGIYRQWSSLTPKCGLDMERKQLDIVVG
jgi:hypothetical protein